MLIIAKLGRLPWPSDPHINYKEANVLITSSTGLTLARVYADASPFPIMAITDHAPLQWIKTATKGPVTGWRIENLTGLNYTI